MTHIGFPFKRDLTHFVKWPKYIRIARQKKILMDRLKTPPPINLFRHTLDKATVVSLFKFLDKMRPEEKQARKKRRMEGAQYIAKAIADASPAPAEQPKEKEEGKPAAAAAPAEVMPKKERKAVSLKKKAALHEALKTLAARRPIAVKYGLNHVTNLVEKNKAQLVVIAHDVDPIELVVWLPALCRKKKIPFCVVKSKARLGRLVHKKTCSCLCITRVKKELRDDFAKLVETIKPQFLENASLLRTWGEGKFGLKHRQRKAKQLRRIAKAEAGKAALAAQHS
jgi:large subunit ribosomal protein L7Ae